MMRSKRTWLWVAVLLAAAACAALAVRIVASIDYRNNDFFTFWLAGHLVTQGGNPYDPAQWVAGHQAFGVTWIPNQTYVYPLPLSLLFAPLGWLSLKSAFTVWVALSELMILVALALLAFGQPGSGSGRYFLPLLIGLIFFRPTSLTLFHGQLSGALLLLLAGTIFLWEKGKWEWGSLLLPLLMLKPNIGAPLLALLGAWLLVRKRFRALLAIAAGLLALLVI
ncbi:MAG TPA: glycosyltransferase family 87 protein, partial [Anaerolineales bacterium]|nr:glycosyltransferase family 87 protein [Anaerolineales bacterium]